MGYLLKIKCIDSRVNVHILTSTSVTFTLTMVPVPNLALTHTKLITVYCRAPKNWNLCRIPDLKGLSLSVSALSLFPPGMG